MNQIEKQTDVQIVSNIILNGDLKNLSSVERVEYYNGYCKRLGLDPFTKPFDLLSLNGKLVLYCTRSGAQQLNKLHGVSHKIVARETIADAGVYYVIAQASLPDGRYTESIGAVNINGMKGDQLANTIMKAETKAKRRCTLDLLGLGVLDESELDTISAIKVTQEQTVIAQDDNKAKQKEAEQVQIVESVDQPKQKKSRKKKEDKEQDEVNPEIFTTKYENEDDILIALGIAKTIGELKTLYFANQKLVEDNKELKTKFTNQKNSLQ